MSFDANLYNDHRDILNLDFYDDFNNINFKNPTFNNSIGIGQDLNVIESFTVASNIYSSSNSFLNQVQNFNTIVTNDCNTNTLSSLNSTTNTLISTRVNVNANSHFYSDIINQTDTNINENVLVNNRFLTDSINTNSLTIHSNIINIGTTNSLINVYGTATNVFSTDLNVNDKTLLLNINSSGNSALDYGFSSGIEIQGTGGLGYLKSTTDAKRYLLKTPVETNPNYVLTTLPDDAIYISGTTIIHNNLTCNTSFVVSNDLITNNITVMNLLNTDQLNSDNITINTHITINNNLDTNIISIVDNNISVLNDFTSDFVTSMNDLKAPTMNVEGLYTSTNLQTSNLYIENNFTANNTIVLNSFDTFNLNVLNDALVHTSLSTTNTCTVLSNLQCNECIIDNKISTVSSMGVSNDVLIENNLVVGTDDSTSANINSSVIINNVLEFENNLLAYTGLSTIGKIYRTGGILKIIVDTFPPSMALVGDSSITIDVGTNYTEPGVISKNINNEDLDVYIISIGTTTYNILVSNDLLITDVSSYDVGSYDITYRSTDTNNGLEALLTRQLSIVSPYYAFVITTTDPSNPYLSGSTTYTTNPIRYTEGYFDSNMYWSYYQGTTTAHVVYPPIVVSAGIYQFYTGQTFTLAKSFVDTMNLNNWFVCFKLRKAETSQRFNIYVYFDSRPTYNNTGFYYDPANGITYCSAGQHDIYGYRQVVQFSENGISVGGGTASISGTYMGSGTLYTSGSVVKSEMQSGVFLSLYRLNNTSGLVIHKNNTEFIKVQFSSISNVTYSLPFHIYVNNSLYNLYDGFVFSNSYVNNTDVYNLMPSGSTF